MQNSLQISSTGVIKNKMDFAKLSLQILIYVLQVSK